MYNTKVHGRQGGDNIVVEDGGKITVKSGGSIEVEPGGALAQQAAIASLALVVTDPPTQAEVQAVADKVDAVLAVLRAAGMIAAS